MPDVEVSDRAKTSGGTTPGTARFSLKLAIPLGLGVGILFLVGFGPWSFGPEATTGPLVQATDHKGHDQAPPRKIMYQCPMHPQIIRDKPGKCPICGMDLVPMKEQSVAPKGPQVAGRTEIAVPPARQELSGVAFGRVQKQPFQKTIRAAGRVEYNERLLSTINVKFAGWIERLFVSAVGDEVKPGTPLFEIYSPDLLEAERAYFLAFESADQARRAGRSADLAFLERNLKSARERLLLWDLSEDQLPELTGENGPRNRATYRSKVSGVVTKRSVTAGNYVPAGTELYAVADLSSVWIRAEVYEYEIPWVKVGLGVKVSFASRPEEALEGKVAYLYPALNEQTRTLEVRIEVPNPDRILKPGMFVNAMLEVDLGEKLVIDDQAVVTTGLRHLVFVEEHPGHLVPREIVPGARSGGRVVVEKGLAEGDQIVTQGTFLVDSESRLKAALEGSAAGGPGGHRH